jgi:hypothetical protein
LTSTHSTAVVFSIPSPAERHDELLLDVVAPLFQAVCDAPAVDAAWFTRVNKPSWGLRVSIVAEAAWISHRRETLLRGLGVASPDSALIDEDLEDKWIGGPRVRRELEHFHHGDSRACLEALAAERAGMLGSRSRYSVAFVEALWDAFGLSAQERLELYRRSFEWAPAAGRWDRDVFAALEKTFASQRTSLAAILEPSGDRGWPSPEAARIGRASIEAARAALRSPAEDPGSLALHAARAHSNRLGIHASREAALRYLMWRARGGTPLAP